MHCCFVSAYLNLPAEVVPKSLQKPATQPKRFGAPERPQREAGDRPPRGEYRSRAAADGKTADGAPVTFVSLLCQSTHSNTSALLKPLRPLL